MAGASTIDDGGPAKTFYCSFCAKSQHEVRRLIANTMGDAFICGECLELCLAILRSGGVSRDGWMEAVA
jgi:hypothetical protein